jgi:S-phase kinase-associated protein 1
MSVTLCSLDGMEIKVAENVATLSGTVRDLIEDAGIDNPIPLPNVTGQVLGKVLEYCTYHTEHPVEGDDLCPWDVDFFKVDQSALFELVLAANYMDIRPLLEAACKTIADMIKGKTPEQIRETFNIKNDFTPEEEEQVRKENEWCEER